MIPVFFIEPTDQERASLRRYRSSSEGKCGASGMGYCNAHFPLGDRPVSASFSFGTKAEALAFDTRWPTHCACGYEFSDHDSWQDFARRLYRRIDSGELMTLQDAPVGACWNADWMIDRESNRYRGPDGRCLVVKTPGGEWMIDSRASNCTMPNDDTHRCWVRHGRPEDGTLHVDKNGHTCAAGGGSIVAGSYHGFLHNGQLVEC
jgi:hypothetical protein